MAVDLSRKGVERTEERRERERLGRRGDGRGFDTVGRGEEGYAGRTDALAVESEEGTEERTQYGGLADGT